MKTTRLALFASILFSLSIVHCPAIVGYVNTTFTTAPMLFANPLDNGTGNTLNGLFGASTPNGTTISLWDSASSSYYSTSTYDLGLYGGWSINLTLNPGTGARLTTSSSFINTFVGNVLDRDGTFLSDPENIQLPPLFSSPPGLYLLGDIAPIGSTGTDVFLNVIGRLPNVGEQFIDGVSGTSTYLGGGLWSGPTPTLNVGEAGFYNIIPIPEPSTFALSLLGLALIRLCRRQWR